MSVWGSAKLCPKRARFAIGGYSQLARFSPIHSFRLMNIVASLETPRLSLRELILSDWQAVHKYASNPEVVKYLPFGPNTIKDTKKFLYRNLGHQQTQPREHFILAVTLKDYGELIGSGRISITNVENKEGSIGYSLNQDFWGHGYATEVAAALINFGFKQLQLHRIYATCDPENLSSARILEKIGMKQEGYLREHYLIRAEWRDSLLYAILDHEWKI